MEEVNYLHQAVVDQLKETATHTYNEFLKAYESLNDDKEGSKGIFLAIIKNNDYLFSSLEFYNETFKDLDRSEDYLYISQLLNLQIKACHNLEVIYQSESNKEADKYITKKEEYKKTLATYYQMNKDNNKIGPILEAFLKDVASI